MTENMQHLIAILNSNFLNSLATIATVWVAWLLYNSQIKLNKTQAAMIIVQEIRSAEEKVYLVSGKVSSGDYADLPNVLITNSWNTYSHLFSKDLDQDHWQTIVNFYEVCENIDKMIEKKEDIFWAGMEEKARLVQSKYADLATSDANKKELEKTIVEFSNYGSNFQLDRPLNRIKLELKKFQKITTTPAGEKMKHVAGL